MAVWIAYDAGMMVLAGIDEAGYGPLFGPLVVSRTVFAVPRPEVPQSAEHVPDPLPLPDLWQLLDQAVCRTLAEQRKTGRLAINDSKKLTTAAAGIRHLEQGVLSFAPLRQAAGDHHKPMMLDNWLDDLGETTHHQLAHLPWYAPGPEHPWQALPATLTRDELTIAAGMLRRAASKAGVRLLDKGAAVVLEDRFNQMVAVTRSKASVSFTFVAGHLQHIWQQYGEHHPHVAVDRQSGRQHYRELLAMNFPQAQLQVIEQTPACSTYRLTQAASHSPSRSMVVRFMVDAEQHHLPVALASMICKYTRELLMARFNAWFTQRLPNIAPTAGYGSDGKRFWQQVQPHLKQLNISGEQLKRMA